MHGRNTCVYTLLVLIALPIIGVPACGTFPTLLVVAVDPWTETDARMERRTDGPMDRPTDASDRDAKIAFFRQSRAQS